jgi:CxxC motif-containing protein (DUF1111 family)
MGHATATPGTGYLRHPKFTELDAIRAGIIAVSIASMLFGPRLLAADQGGKKPDPKAVAQGRAIFEREWQPGDSRTHGGDGLGPVFNDSSCVACHNQGGTGGAGSTGKNVDIITATATAQNPGLQVVISTEPRGFLATALRSLIGLDKPAPAPAPGTPATAAKDAKPARPKVDTTELVKAHAGFRTARSIVLHRFGTDEKYEQWRQTFVGFPGMSPAQSPFTTDAMMATQMAMNFDTTSIPNQIGPFAISRSQRNPTALFGAGVIDSIPESDIEAAAKVKHPGFSEIAGRLSRLKDKRIGRFGWKSQTASLSDFVLTACAVELGLEVPAHHQAGSPQHPDALPKGLDLNAQECESLVAYVADLPRPAERNAETDRESNEIQAGRALFAKVGCATCHAPKLGNVEGLYSDLLLHDLGPALGDVGQYGVFDPSSSEEEIVDDPGSVADAGGAAGPTQPMRVPGGLVPPPPETAVTVSSAATPASGPIAGVSPSPPPDVVISPPAAEPPSPATAPAPQFVFGSPIPQIAGPSFVIGHGAGVVTAPRPKSGPASQFEWRTPPLWGFRDSAPYLHDGRAKTLDQAIALHGGEATRIAQGFFSLTAKERRQVETFMKSLTAPAKAELVASTNQ